MGKISSKKIRKGTFKPSKPQSEEVFQWKNKMELVGHLREGLPYSSIEIVSKRAGIPVKNMLEYLSIPQTTYNKKKKDNDLLNGRDSEIILILSEVLSYGTEVFNGENEKFRRWLKKPNLSLGGASPETLLDSVTGILEIKNALNRIEYGNFA